MLTPDTFGTGTAPAPFGEVAEQVVARLEANLVQARSRAEFLPKPPKAFFEEWDDLLISGIGWVSQLVEIAGGIDIFTDRAGQVAAKTVW
jgi:iron complex transport system substrate-binding protein